MPTVSLSYLEIRVLAPEILIKETVKQQLQDLTAEESQVIVHCSYFTGGFEEKIRIWKSTFLMARESAHRSKLLYVENISLYPDWTDMERYKEFRFTLIFSALPKDCKVFDLVETIPEPGGFEVRGIGRNGVDVYRVEVG